MTRLIPLRVVAQTEGYQPSYVSKIARDQERPAEDRRFPQHTHDRFPPFFKEEGRRDYFTTETEYRALRAKRGQNWSL